MGQTSSRPRNSKHSKTNEVVAALQKIEQNQRDLLRERQLLREHLVTHNKLVLEEMRHANELRKKRMESEKALAGSA